MMNIKKIMNVLQMAFTILFLSAFTGNRENAYGIEDKIEDLDG